MSLAPDDLKALSRWLDEGLALPEAARAGWLDELPAEAAPLAPTLRRLLSASASRETADLLDRGPAFAPSTDASPPCESSAYSAGDMVGPYRLLRTLGAGGMGEVWLAERADGQLKRAVALKLPLLGLRHSVLVQRFARERDILGGLAHPHIARLYDAGLADDSQPYLALEFVEGVPITEHCRAQGVALAGRVAMLLQVMDAVQYAHANLVIHRDLKPSNVLVTAAGQAMLLDFGIAKLMQDEQGEAAETELTRLGGRALTLAYAAPEQLSGAPISIATDVWALGVLLYELIAGRRPFDGDRRQIEQAVLNRDPATPAGVPADLATVALKALKKAPAERYATVDAFADDLRRWQRGAPVRAQPDSLGYRLRRFVGRNTGAVAAGAGVLATVLAAAGVALWQAQVAREQSRIALTEAKTAQAVQNFLEGIFRANSGDQADPLRARQRTAKELLDEGAARIDGVLDDAPAAKLRVLETLRAMYFDMGELERVVAMLDRQVALAPRAFGPGSTAEIEARARRANALMDLVRFDEARADLDRAAALLGQGATVEPAVRAEIHAAASALHTHSSKFYDPGRALAEIDAALALLHSLPPSRRLVDALSQRATVMDALRRPREALAATQEALALLRRDPRVGHGTEVTLLWEMADAHAELGEAAEAERVYREALSVAAARHGAKGDVAFWTHTVFIRFLARQSRLREAAALADEAVAILRGWPDSADRSVARIGLLRFAAYAYLRLGRLDEVAAMLAQVDTDTVGPAPQDTERIWYRLQRRAWLDTERGDFGAAALALEQAEALVVSASLAAHPFMDEHRVARVRLATARGDGAQALSVWAAGWPQAAGGDLAGVRPPHAALYPQALLARGDMAGASRACEQALTALAHDPQRARLADHEIDLQELMGAAQLALGDATAAESALREADRLGTMVLDADRSPRLARIHALLGQALLARGDRAGARARADAAAAIITRQGQLGRQYTEPLRRLRQALSGSGVATRTSR